MPGLLLGAAVSFVWCLVAVRLGPAVGFVDRPDDPSLKAHERPAVPLGGIGVFVGVHTAMAVSGRFDLGLFAATSIVLVLGLVDDRRGLAPTARLGIELVAAAMLVLFADIPLNASSLLDLIVGLVLVVVFINAVNLFDGLDGLVGGSGLVAALGVAWLAAVRNSDSALGLALAGALAGFLVLNWHPAKVFLGDNGAYTVGVLLAYGVLGASPDGVGVGLGIAMVLLGVFGLDLVATVIRRRLSGSPLFTGDRSHLYDQLRDRGRSVPVVVGIAAGAQALFVLAAIGLDVVGLGHASWLVIGSLVLVLLAGLNAGGFLRGAQPD